MGIGIWNNVVPKDRRHDHQGPSFLQPEGWVFLKQAFVNLGLAKYEQDGWIGNIWEWAELPVTTPRSAEDGPEQERAATRNALISRAAAIRFNLSMEIIRLLKKGQIQSGIQRKGGGPVTALPATAWEVTDPLWRFEFCALNPDPDLLFDPHAEQTHWIYVSRSSYMNVLDAWRRGDFFVSEGEALPATSYKRKPTPQQNRLVLFLKSAGRYLPGGEDWRSMTYLRTKYKDWNDRQRPPLAPLQRTAFEERVNRWLKDER